MVQQCFVQSLQESLRVKGWLLMLWHAIILSIASSPIYEAGRDKVMLIALVSGTLFAHADCVRSDAIIDGLLKVVIRGSQIGAGKAFASSASILVGLEGRVISCDSSLDTTYMLVRGL